MFSTDNENGENNQSLNNNKYSFDEESGFSANENFAKKDSFNSEYINSSDSDTSEEEDNNIEMEEINKENTNKEEIKPTINKININNTFLNLNIDSKNENNNNNFMNMNNIYNNINTIGTANINLGNIPLQKNNSFNSSNNNTNSGNIKNRKKSLKSTVKGVFNYVLGKDSQKDLEEEIEQLKNLYGEMEMQMKLISSKTILFRNRFISRVSYFFTYVTGKILAFYCIYRIIMTVKNLLFQNYSDINVMLREEVVNIIDFFITIIFKILNLDVETIYYTVIEQYFSLTIVGTIIIINIRSFLNTILFIYTITLKKYNSQIDRNLTMVSLSYFVGLFYVTSSIFLIFNLPITYRYY